MGADWIPATVFNGTDDVTLIVVDGNQWGRFLQVGPGQKSESVVASIDGFGAYSASNLMVPLLVIYSGKTSTWWKTPDCCCCAVTRSNGNLIMTAQYIPFCGPSATAAKDWEYDPGRYVSSQPGAGDLGDSDDDDSTG